MGGQGISVTCRVQKTRATNASLLEYFLSSTMATQQKQKQKQKQAITLKGSCALVTEFFKYSVNT